VLEFEANATLDGRHELGEGCRWDEVRSELYWVDVEAGKFFRASDGDQGLSITRTYDVGGYLSAVAPYENRDDGWIVGWNQSVAKLSESGQVEVLASPEAANAGRVRMNDGAADPWGRFLIGSMAFDVAPGKGSFYSYDGGREAPALFRNVQISNGLGWSPDRKTMYYIDSGPHTIHAFSVSAKGELGEKKLFRQFKHERDGAPDGMCVDAEGALWVAFWDGGEVRRYSPLGELIARVHVPVSRPTCCSIGGATGTTLFITTAWTELNDEQLAKEPDAGRLFAVDVGVRGQPINAFAPRDVVA
jgi:sugar lactone lactonase YvrE